ncbi:toprim domain-containing protein [Salegentibacter sp. UBA1130]|uniref:toprim domain-containing protein n=1 Tax=Salegentibacter sp. UBA1130 TaxID=1947451 RepID=UPI00257A035A|nr:toprim domain-containing protein [Salegentibacter sp. UBA1130]
MINWEDIDTKGRSSGQIKVKCPACIDRRTNKRDKSLSVNLNTGRAKCHYCDEVSFRESEETESPVEYKLPVQTWKNYTTLSDKVVKWFKESRNISQSTLIDCRITEENYYQPQLNKKVNNIVFNYFEGETIVNKKYRSGDKKFTQSAGTKNIFYGINDIIDADEVYIVEGEMDKLALWEIGIKNAVSVPNGANDNDDVWKNSEKYIKNIQKFYIATDCDKKGQELSEKIAQRLGRWRCLRIEFKNKDANDDLMEGRDVLEKSISSPKRYAVSGTFRVDDLYPSILDLYDNGLPETISPKREYFGDLKEIFSTMRGHLVTGTGIPSHGKSNFVDWYVLNIVNDYNLKASFFSPEHSPMELHQTSFIQKFTGKPFFENTYGVEKVTKAEIEKYRDWANERIYLTGPEGNESPTWGWLLNKFKEQMYSFGIDVFVIDAFNKVLFDRRGNKLDLINECLTELTSFAQRNNVIIFLIAHPTKMQKNESGVYACPTLYDVAGSADFRNQTHDGFTIYRYFGDPDKGTTEGTEFINMKTKYGFQGKIGESISFNYHKPSGRYYAKGIPFSTECLIDKPDPNTPQQASESLWNVEGDEDDEIPF